ncbi:hypothetical protein [Halostella salina]|uniref:hypothetical protein n=1 Tax=Halostella salina TaxID=1547897 RepID=UPI000EF82F14|nr:hypothetical protein [Halostella salina]
METLELPTGETVTPEDVFLFGGYPYRFRPGDDDAAFYLSPLYWGGGEMDIPFDDRDQLVDQWGEDGRAEGPLSESEWADWLVEARAQEQFDADELDAIAREVGVDRGGPIRRLLRRFR